MICKNNKTGNYFNYDFVKEPDLKDDLVNIWNPILNINEIISYKQWLQDYIIINKWKIIKPES